MDYLISVLYKFLKCIDENEPINLNQINLKSGISSKTLYKLRDAMMKTCNIRPKNSTSSESNFCLTENGRALLEFFGEMIYE